MLDAPQHPYLPFYAKAADLLIQIAALRPVSHNEQLKTFHPAKMSGKRIDQHIDAFFLAEASHKANGGIAVPNAKRFADAGYLSSVYILRHKVGEIHNIGNDIDMAFHSAAVQKFHDLFGGPDDLGSPIGHTAKIDMRGRFYHVLKTLRRNIKHIIIIHCVQGIYDRPLQLTRGKLSKNTHAEFRVDVDDVRIKITDNAQTLNVERVGKPVSVNALERNGGAVQYPILDIMAYGLVVRGDDHHLVALAFETVFQRFDMGNDTADKGKVRLCKNGDFHKMHSSFRHRSL